MKTLIIAIVVALGCSAFAQDYAWPDGNRCWTPPTDDKVHWNLKPEQAIALGLCHLATQDDRNRWAQEDTAAAEYASAHTFPDPSVVGPLLDTNGVQIGTVRQVWVLVDGVITPSLTISRPLHPASSMAARTANAADAAVAVQILVAFDLFMGNCLPA